MVEFVRPWIRAGLRGITTFLDRPGYYFGNDNPLKIHPSQGPTVGLGLDPHYAQSPSNLWKWTYRWETSIFYVSSPKTAYFPFEDLRCSISSYIYYLGSITEYP